MGRTGLESRTKETQMITRKNQQDLTTKEWDDFIDAINKTHGVKTASPAYRDFVKLHTRAMNVQDAQGMSFAQLGVDDGLGAVTVRVTVASAESVDASAVKTAPPSTFLPFFCEVALRTWIPAVVADGIVTVVEKLMSDALGEHISGKLLARKPEE